MSVHVGILSPCLSKAKVTQLEHWRIAVIQKSVVQLEVPAHFAGICWFDSPEVICQGLLLNLNHGNDNVCDYIALKARASKIQGKQDDAM